jgi:endonuclease-8
MPEGPEVRRAADRIARVLVGSPLSTVVLEWAAIAPWESALVGAVTERVETRGKYFVLHFSVGAVLVVHLQLYGRWRVVAPGAPPDRGRSLRVTLGTERGEARLYSATALELVSPEALPFHAGLARLGPDLLSDGLGAEAIAARLEARAFAGRALGALLLDQGFIAGVGNYLRSEMLFEAGVSPWDRPRDLDAAARVRLGIAVRAVGERALRTGGTTLPPALLRERRALGARGAARRHQVFGLAGLPCPRCGGRVQRADAAGRRVYWCPGCQPGRGPRAAASREE